MHYGITAGGDGAVRRRGRIDRNHGEIVKALRDARCSVQSLANIGGGCPDLLVGFRGKNYVLEVKDGLLTASERKLTDDERIWHACWMGSAKVVNSVEEAFKAIGL